MKQRLNILLVILLLLIAGTFSVSAQIVDADGQYVDTTFNDHVDRTAEDFVTVSLMMSQPSKHRLYSIFGHVALRLQCPTFNLDYVFSYISTHFDASVLSYLFIIPKMGLIALHTPDYIKNDFRGIREYELYLSPNMEMELWRILDEEISSGCTLPYNCVSHSCAQMVYQYVNRAIDVVNLKDSVHTNWIYEPDHTMHELMNIYAKNAPWQLLVMNSLLGSSYVDDVHMANGRKILFPEQLLALWHNTTLCGNPILSVEAEVYTTSEIMTAPIITPLRIAIVLLLLALCSFATLFCGKIMWVKKAGNGIDYLLLGLQTLAGTFMMVMMWVAYLPFPQTHWNWLLIPFNILPIVCWEWRKYWALPYATILVVWCIVMVFVPHMLVDTPHIILTLAFSIVLFKQSNIMQRFINKSVAQDIVKLSNRGLTKKK